MSPEGFAIRRASTDDIGTLVAHRRAMFVDMGCRDETALDARPPNVTLGCLPG